MTTEEQGFRATLEGQGWHDRVNHYAYADWLEEHGCDDEAKVHRDWAPSRQQAAEEFMDDYAEMLSGYDDADPDGPYRKYTRDEVIQAARESLTDRAGSRICLGFDTPEGVWSKREVFWVHFSVLTGVPVAEGYRETFVRCACWRGPS